jgi:hypothetical protein
MASLHVICRNSLGLSVTKFPVFESGDWDISAADAERLVGGTLYLHETKGQHSYFGGSIIGYRELGPTEPLAGRIVFTVTSTREGKNVAWQGASHAMAWSSGAVD